MTQNRSGADRDAYLQLALQRMPHRGQMLLIDRVLEASEDEIRCLSRCFEPGTHPLAERGQLYAVSLIELGAQTAAAHASLSGNEGGHAGMLIALQNVNLRHANVVDETSRMEISARRVDRNAAARYEFRIFSGKQELISGEALMTIVDSGALPSNASHARKAR